MISLKDIKSSVFQHFAENFTEEVDWGDPSRFDPDQDSGIQSWVTVMVEFPRGTPTRANCDYGPMTLQLDVASRYQDRLYETEDLADEVRSVFDTGEAVVVYDYSQSEEPVVGFIRCHEPEVRDLTREGDVWRKARITIPARFQETP